MPEDLFNRAKWALFKRGTLPPGDFYDLKKSIFEKQDEIWKDLPPPRKLVTALSEDDWTETDEGLYQQKLAEWKKRTLGDSFRSLRKKPKLSGGGLLTDVLGM